MVEILIYPVISAVFFSLHVTMSNNDGGVLLDRFISGSRDYEISATAWGGVGSDTLGFSGITSSSLTVST